MTVADTERLYPIIGTEDRTPCPYLDSGKMSRPPPPGAKPKKLVRRESRLAEDVKKAKKNLSKQRSKIMIDTQVSQFLHHSSCIWSRSKFTDLGSNFG